MGDYADKMHKCIEYVQALEDERRKIKVFQRELPLCLELVNQAIETCKQQLSGGTTTVEYTHGHSDCSEQTSNDGPVLAEFIPIKRCEDDVQQYQKCNKSCKDNKKSDWLRSVQLWNQTPNLEDFPRRTAVVEVKNGNGGAFQPFHQEKIGEKLNQPACVGKAGSSTPTAATSSTTETATKRSGGSCKKEEKEEQWNRKQRRAWSPELHRRFLHALEQLGGSHVATPKQIREFMKVDGLTNDEVKSHLQKYRLHTRRPSPTMHNNGNSQTPQFVVVGGIWVPPQPAEYAASALTSTSGERNNGMYAPAAATAAEPSAVLLPQEPQLKQAEGRSRSSHSEGGGHSHSPATSSSTHTRTASPGF